MNVHRRGWMTRVLQGSLGSCVSGILFESLAATRLVAMQRDDTDDLFTTEVDQAIERGLQFLRNRQTDEGCFTSARWGQNVAVCGLVGLSMLSRGIRPGIGSQGQPLHNIGRYILGACQESGFIKVDGTSSHGPMYEHGFATLFLGELYGTAIGLDVRDRLHRAVELIVRSQNKQGGWRYDPRPQDADLSVTVCQVMALRAARNAGIDVASETIDRAIDYVRRSQNGDGGFMYQLNGGESRFALTAAAIVALYNAGVHEGKDLDQAFDFLQKHFANAQSIQQNSYFFYAHYYSVQAFWHRGGDNWKLWYRRLRDLILPLQQNDGSWFDHSSSEYGTAMACMILNMPRSVLPIFQR